MEKWKPLRASHFSTPPTATDLLTHPLRYTNNLAGSKHRARHWQSDVSRSLQSVRIPAVRKAENLRVQRHDIQGQCAVSPSTKRRPFPCVFFESQDAEPFREHRIFGV